MSQQSIRNSFATCINLPTETYPKNPKNATLGGHIAKSPRAQGVALIRLSGEMLGFEAFRIFQPLQPISNTKQLVE